MIKILTRFTLALASLLAVTMGASASNIQDRYVGYYYPSPQQVEVYCARLPIINDVSKKRRVGFIIGIKEGMNKQPYESPFTVFAKGGESTKLIIIAKTDGYLDTVYRARALLADLSTSARTTPIFAKSKAPEELTFLDLISLLGFQSVTLSNGDGFAHQVVILPLNHANCQARKSQKETAD